MLLLPPPIPSKIPPLNPINRETAGGIRKGLEKKEMDTGGGGVAIKCTLNLLKSS